MRVKAQAYQPPEGNESAQRLPPVLENLREWAITQVTTRMRIFAISKLSVRPAQAGIRVLNEVSFKPMAESIPGELLVLRNSVARQEAEFMLSFGITDAELVTTEEDMVQMRKAWENMGKYQKAPEQTEAGSNSGSSIREIPLNVEMDPSGKNVLDEPAPEPAQTT